MLVRKQIELARAAMARELCTPVLASRAALLARIRRAWGRPTAIVTLSVRSLLDAFLAVRGYGAGEEVVMTGANVPDMAAIVAHHRLRVRAVDFDLVDLAPPVERIAAAIGPRTRAIVFAQLFGSRVDLAGVAALARRLGIDLIEDAAQAFDVDYRGHPEADLSMFSFGPIKTATALGGAVASVRDPALCAALEARLSAWPVASGIAFRRRLAKYLALTSLARPWPLRQVARFCDLDRILTGSARSFAGRDLMTAIRERPSRPLLRLLARRLEHLPERFLRARSAAGDELQLRLAGAVGLPRRSGTPHSHWVFPVLCDDPEALVNRLHAAGYDATRRATLGPIAPHLPELERSFRRLVYLPFSPAHRIADRERIAGIVAGCGRRRSDPAAAAG